MTPIRTALLVLCIAAMAFMPTQVRCEVSVFKVEIGLPNTIALMIRGSYDGNEILRVKSAIAEIEPGKRIIAILESPGGLVDQGEGLGQFFYDARIPTLVLAGSTCASACNQAFLGGRDPVTGESLRILASGARLGFHNFSRNGIGERVYSKTELEDLSRTMQQLVFGHLLHLKRVNAPLRLMQLSMGTKAEGVNFITEGDALDYGIAILNRETGKLVRPESIERRTQRLHP